jgi:hypothetical protein
VAEGAEDKGVPVPLCGYFPQLTMSFYVLCNVSFIMPEAGTAKNMGEEHRGRDTVLSMTSIVATSADRAARF